jgi:hypothetical protein
MAVLTPKQQAKEFLRLYRLHNITAQVSDENKLAVIFTKLDKADINKKSKLNKIIKKCTEEIIYFQQEYKGWNFEDIEAILKKHFSNK